MRTARMTSLYRLAAVAATAILFSVACDRKEAPSTSDQPREAITPAAPQGAQLFPLPRVQSKDEAADRNLPQMIWYGIEPAVGADKQRAAKLIAACKIAKLRRHIARRISEK